VGGIRWSQGTKTKRTHSHRLYQGHAALRSPAEKEREGPGRKGGLVKDYKGVLKRQRGMTKVTCLRNAPSIDLSLVTQAGQTQNGRWKE